MVLNLVRVCAFAVVIVAGYSTVQATDPAIHSAGWKITGDQYHAGAAAMHQQHAQSRAARTLYGYSQAAQSPGVTYTPETAAELTTTIRASIEKSNKSLAALKPTVKNDEVAKKLIASIEDHHKKALGHCDMVAKAADAKALSECCADAAHELHDATVDMEKLTKHLKVVIPGVTVPVSVATTNAKN